MMSPADDNDVYIRGTTSVADNNDVYSTWEGRQRQMTMTYIYARGTSAADDNDVYIRGRMSPADDNEVYSTWEGVSGRRQ